MKQARKLYKKHILSKKLVSKFLIIDCGFLCHRAFHSMGGLVHGDEPTGVIYGVFKDLQEFAREFQTQNVIFCFDHGKGKRYGMYPTYKAKRQAEKAAASPEDAAKYAGLQNQIENLKKRILSAIGFQNIQYQKGYEADDMIACVAERIPDYHEAIMITSDQDMLQCIRPNVSFYNPNKKKLYTYQNFVDEWSIEPEDFGMVKAIAGCSTDEVAGIKGVGEKTAAKYLAGELNTTSKKYKDIEDDMALENSIIGLNTDIVVLPLEGTKVKPFRKDRLDPIHFEIVCRELGFKSFLPNQNKGKLLQGKRKGIFDHA